jgi:hypothetical protein
MIRYALVCEHNHTFEGWFASSSTYEKQAKRGLVTCPSCGSTKVEKAIMAPAVQQSRGRDSRPDPGSPDKPQVAIVSEQERELRRKLKELREHLIKNADYVGGQFPEEARRMHYGEIKRRSIYGEATPEEARELREEGIEFHPLPRLPDEFN